MGVHFRALRVFVHQRTHVLSCKKAEYHQMSSAACTQTLTQALTPSGCCTVEFAKKSKWPRRPAALIDDIDVVVGYG